MCVGPAWFSLCKGNLGGQRLAVWSLEVVAFLGPADVRGPCWFAGGEQTKFDDVLGEAGLAAMAGALAPRLHAAPFAIVDEAEGEPGAIELQGDHGPVEFRNLILTPLYKPQNR